MRSLTGLTAMPIYEYIADDPAQSCHICAKGFELMRPLDREPLTHCLHCKQPIRKVISRVNTPKLTKPLSVSDAKKAGFTVMKRRDKGVYEKL